jgi:hypothetical protein
VARRRLRISGLIRRWWINQRLLPGFHSPPAKARVCVRTVATALQRLKALGILTWVRHCAES